MASQFPQTDPNPGLVDYRVAEGVALLTLNDPPANTYSYDMMQQIDACVLAARMDEGVEAIVITGGGEKFFCAGADIRLARRNAGKMGLPEVTLGVLPGTGGTQRLARAVGKSRAIELMATGELFSFEKGQELRLINQIYDGESG